MKIVNPATGAMLAEVAVDGHAAVRRKYELARAAQPRWGALPLKKRLDSSPKEQIHFVEIENHGMEGLNAVASALYEIHGPGTTAYPEKEQFALVIYHGQPSNRRYEWTVESVKFPYKPNSYVPPEKPVDDGHGHAPGGH